MNQGISILQGPHQVAQKLSSTTFALIIGQLHRGAVGVLQREIRRGPALLLGFHGGGIHFADGELGAPGESAEQDHGGDGTESHG